MKWVDFCASILKHGGGGIYWSLDGRETNPSESTLAVTGQSRRVKYDAAHVTVRYLARRRW